MRPIGIMAAAAATLLLAAACQQEELNPTVPGREISFNVSTIYSNGIATRTEYSDENIEVNGRNYERINWVIGDPITVYSPEASVSTGSHYANYKVKAVSTSGASSIATVTSEYPFYWGDGVNNFVALYPSPGTDGTDSGLSMEGSQITAVIPANQSDVSMKYAYMYSTSAARESDTSVSLEFHPLINAFHFSFYGDAQTGAVLKSLSLSSASNTLAGAFSVDVDSSDWSLASSEVDVKEDDASKTISVSFGDNGVELPLAENGAQPFEYTIFAIPDQLTQLTLTLTFKKDGTESVKTLELKDGDEWITVPSGRKVNITSNVPVPVEGWTYTLEDVEPGMAMALNQAASGSASKSIYSYKTSTNDNTVEEVALKFRYSPADGNGNNLEQWSENLPAWLSSMVVSAHNAEQNPDDAFTLTGSFTEMPGVEVISKDETEEHIAILKSKGNNGASSSAPQDLALYDIDNLSSPRAAGARTANCYVVDRAGWYMFPLVYGNAVDWEKAPADGRNAGAFYDGLGDDWDCANYYVLHRFKNYLNVGITSPYILDDINKTVDDMEAVILWEDVSSDKLFINTAEIVASPSTAAVYKDEAGNGKTVPYIKFDVDAGNIRQGNAVIALREKEGDRRIVWSWHIWVTDADLSTQTVYTRSTTVPSNQMLKVNLGWCDTRIEATVSYTPRKYYVEVSQEEGNADPVVFVVSQDDSPTISSTLSSGTFYQFGRKDPFLPLQGRFGSLINKDSCSPAGYNIVDGANAVQFISDNNPNDGNVSYGIQNPFIQYDRGKNYGWVASQERNLWDVGETSGSGHAYNSGVFDQRLDRKVVKSIYDPCPPGFSVPNYMAFSIFTSTGGNLPDDSWNPENPVAEDGQGFYFNTSDSDGETIYFPTQGYRAGGQLGCPRASLYYFTSKASGTRYSLMLIHGGPVWDLSKSNAYAVRPVKE